jgi:hypothetical protein
MSKGDISAVERIIGTTINETARGDPHALAARVVAALTAAGFRIVPADGIEDTALGPQRADARPLYRSPNGDTCSWPAIPRRARRLSGTKQMHHQAVR